MLIRWDTVSPTFLGDPPDIPQTTIQTIISKELMHILLLRVWAIYYYDGIKLFLTNKYQEIMQVINI